MNSLNQHTTVAHPTAAHNPGHPQAVRPKPAPVQRPEIDLGTSETDWNFFKAEFDRYKRTTGISGQTILDELLHCQTKELRVLLQSDSTTATLDTETKLLDKLKSLAVTTLHSAVHLIALRDLKQAQAESIRAFIARARSTATNCGLSKACVGCQAEVSFVEETLFGVVLAGLFDGNIQQKILSLAAMKTITTLEQLATYVAAEESGKSERGQLGTSNNLAGLRRQSTYKARHQSLDKPEKCRNCGGSSHGNGSYADRLKLCPAQGKTCSSCQRKHHLSSVCRSGKQAAAAAATADPTDTASHGSLAVARDDIWDPPDSPDNLSFFFIQTATARDSQLHMPAVTSVQQLAALARQLRSDGDHISTIPLPHAIHRQSLVGRGPYPQPVPLIQSL